MFESCCVINRFVCCSCLNIRAMGWITVTKDLSESFDEKKGRDKHHSQNEMAVVIVMVVNTTDIVPPFFLLVILCDIVSSIFLGSTFWWCPFCNCTITHDTAPTICKFFGNHRSLDTSVSNVSRAKLNRRFFFVVMSVCVPMFFFAWRVSEGIMSKHPVNSHCEHV